ncbi:hypothetical protein B0O99DRAFT_628761 [Bisporella sp. PMI_857]|nr:hypothetical protein B0O99DRAFT_628761 [Bisporella sp. PMI_857]
MILVPMNVMFSSECTRRNIRRDVRYSTSQKFGLPLHSSYLSYRLIISTFRLGVGRSRERMTNQAYLSVRTSYTQEPAG